MEREIENILKAFEKYKKTIDTELEKVELENLTFIAIDLLREIYKRENEITEK